MKHQNLYMLTADQITQLLQKLEEDEAITIDVDVEQLREALNRIGEQEETA